MEENREIVFSKETDSIIEGFALSLAFLSVALFVWFDRTFHNRMAETIVCIVMLIFGISGAFFEIEKVSYKRIEGLSDLGTGIFVSVLSFLGIIKLDYIIVDIICLFFLFVGVYALYSGFFKILYSLKIQERKSKNKKVELFKIITGLTEVIALIVVILQLVMEVKAK